MVSKESLQCCQPLSCFEKRPSTKCTETAEKILIMMLSRVSVVASSLVPGTEWLPRLPEG